MSEYIVTARKWRPMKFEDVVGQEHVTVTLRNAIATNRLAHAYLFSGPRGVGKTTTARILAKAVNCLHPMRGKTPTEYNPDNECDVCREITEGRSFDVLEIDGASNRGVEEIRNLRESVRYAPVRGTYKVYTIDEVHMLTKEAFNALLKTLEEPPQHVLFIFATTEIHKVPATIVSRCQRFDFRRIAIDEIIANLKGIASEEGLQLDEDSFLLIAKKGDGSLRDAQSIFDQVVSLCGRNITHSQILQALNIVDQELYFRVTDLIRTKNARGGLELVEEIMHRGYDLKEFLTGLTEHLRNIMIAKMTESTRLIEASDNDKRRYAGDANVFTISDLLRLQRLVNGTETAIRWSAQPRFRLEADLVQMISMQGSVELSELIDQLDTLKKKLDDSASAPSTGIHTPPGPGRAEVPRAPGSPISPARAAKPLLRDSGNGNSRPANQPDATAPMPLSEDELSARWPEFVSEVRREKISLGSILESSTLLGVKNGVIRLGCANDFQASSILRNKEVLGGFLLKIFNVRARLEVETGGKYQHSPKESGTTSTVSGHAPASPPDTPAQGTEPQEEHPIVKAIIRELGAEPLE
jgi:DNA polymerase-3 subunit gamma/tau